MSSSENKSLEVDGDEALENAASRKKGPISFLSGAITSGLFAWGAFVLSKRVVIYFTLHSPDYASPIAQSVASGFKTLIIGICFLSTFTFGFIGLGLILVFVRSLFDGRSIDTD